MLNEQERMELQQLCKECYTRNGRPKLDADPEKVARMESLKKKANKPAELQHEEVRDFSGRIHQDTKQSEQNVDIPLCSGLILSKNDFGIWLVFETKNAVDALRIDVPEHCQTMKDWAKNKLKQKEVTSETSIKPKPKLWPNWFYKWVKKQIILEKESK